ncbi:MAG: SRPBCC family protein [Candidatus Velthaea sp.]
MAEHRAAVRVNAPVQQVYALFSHFNDYPKFMSYVKEVTYLDDQRSHWVVDVAGTHEWDAVNEDWIPERQIGWRSISGVNNRGHVTFDEVGANLTEVSVAISYEPPAGLLGKLGEALGAGGHFEQRLQRDLEHFAQMVEQAPAGALDPTSSAYLFHDESAAAKGKTTAAQDQTMGMGSDLADDPPSTVETVGGRSANLDDEITSGTAPTSRLGANTAFLDESSADPAVPGTTKRERDTL